MTGGRVFYPRAAGTKDTSPLSPLRYPSEEQRLAKGLPLAESLYILADNVA